MEGIQVSTHVAGTQNQISVIKVGGYIDTTTSSEVERALNSLLKQKRYDIIIDLSNVDYISSAGWGIFISEIKTIRENGGDLKLVGMIPDVYEIFELLEFHHILDVHDTIQDAVRAFEANIKAPATPVTQEEPASVGSGGSGSGDVQPETAGTRTSETVAAPTASEPAPAQSVTSEPPTVRDLPLEDKIRYIIAQHPDWGALRIYWRLKDPVYGNEKASWFQIRRMLKEMGLDTKKKRQEFAIKEGRQYTQYRLVSA